MGLKEFNGATNVRNGKVVLLNRVDVGWRCSWSVGVVWCGVVTSCTSKGRTTAIFHMHTIVKNNTPDTRKVSKCLILIK